VRARLHLALLRLYRHLPTALRRFVVRRVSPSYTVGTMCFVERADGAILLVRHSYRSRWGTPGGLLARGEDTHASVRREVLEEVGIEIELLGEPAVVVEPDPRRVDVVSRARVVDSAEAAPRSPEIVDAGWFRPDELPELQEETTRGLITLARILGPSVDSPTGQAGMASERSRPGKLG